MAVDMIVGARLLKNQRDIYTYLNKLAIGTPIG
jgi:hypothetical protein